MAQPRGSPAYAALADRIRLLVLDGRLALGTRLPAERELAAHLTLSRTTISAAYAELRDEIHDDRQHRVLDEDVGERAHADVLLLPFRLPQRSPTII